MRRRATSVSLLILLLVTTLVVALDIRLGRAQDIIYIRADGSVDPPTAPISRHKDVYTFTDNIYDEIVVERSDIKVDGAGYTLQARALYEGNGLSWSGINNVTIQNINIQEYLWAVYMYSSSFSSVTGNNITNCGEGVVIDPLSSRNTVSGNTIANSLWYGVELWNSSSTIVSGNTIVGTGYNDIGVLIDESSVNIVSGNNITNCGDYGVAVYGSLDNVVSGNNITDNYCGVYLESSYNNTISDNSIMGSENAVYLYLSSNNTVYRNTIRNITNAGIDFSDSSDSNTISENQISNGLVSISLQNSANATLKSNIMLGNRCGLKVEGNTVGSFIHDIDPSNTINDKPIYYLLNQKDRIIDSSTYPSIGCLALINSTNITVEGLRLENNTQGVLFAYTTNSKIRNNVIVDNDVGIDLISSSNVTVFANHVTSGSGISLSSSDNNTVSQNTVINCLDAITLSGVSNTNISGNNITNNGDVGVMIDSSVNNIVSRNNITNNEAGGLYLYSSSSNVISGNNITSNNNPSVIGFCVVLQSSFNNVFSKNNITNNRARGVWLYGASNNAFSGNNVASNYYGGVQFDSLSNNNVVSGNSIANNGEYGIYFYGASNNTISGNNVTDNYYGIYFLYLQWSGAPNKFYHNNFISNTIQVLNNGHLSVFDNGYPSGGNYWSNYTGSDANGDGIGDTPHIIDSDNQDRYPLLNPWPSHDVAVTSLSASKNIVVRGDSVLINVTVADQGDFLENFILTVCANNTIIATQDISMPNRGLTTVTFSWNTTNYAYGPYIISANVTAVSDETDVADNTCIDGTLTVTILGDVNGDGRIDNFDLSILSNAYGSMSPSPEWNPVCDLNGDGKIDILDLYQLGRNYGKP